MPRLKFERDFTTPIDDSRRKTYPMGWEGLVEDTVVAWEAVDGKHAVFVGDAPPRPPAPDVAATIEIPTQWESLPAADLVDLARKLGAGDEVKTKAAAGDVVEVELARRKALS